MCGGVCFARLFRTSELVRSVQHNFFFLKESVLVVRQLILQKWVVVEKGFDYTLLYSPLIAPFPMLLYAGSRI